MRSARTRRLALAVASAACLAGCAGTGDAGSPSTSVGSGAVSAPSFVVVTSGGTALGDGATDVVPTLDLRVSAGSALEPADVGAVLDGRVLTLSTASGAVTASVPALPLASTHTLDLTIPGRSLRRITFHVVAPVAVHAALHADPTDGTVLDVAFALAPDQAAVGAHLATGGVPTWVDPSHLRLHWGTAPGGTLLLPATIATGRGSHLAGALSLDLGAVATGTERSADVPDAGTIPASTMVVGFSVSRPGSRGSSAAHTRQLSVLSPTGLVAGADGAVTGEPDPPEVADAVASGVALMPLVQQLDAAAATALATDPAAARRLAGELRSRVAAGRWLGVQLDVENLAGSAAGGYAALVTAVAGALHADARRLAVDVVPHRPGHLTDASAGYRLPVIAGAADQVVLMAYEEHTAGGPPGPIAGRGWQEELLAGSLPELGDPAHVLLGLPLYGRTWPGDGSGSITDSYTALVGDALAVPGARVDYDFDGATPYIVGRDGSRTYTDDAPSLSRKLALVDEHHLGGVAMWRLGFEDPALWGALPTPAPAT